MEVVPLSDVQHVDEEQQHHSDSATKISLFYDGQSSNNCIDLQPPMPNVELNHLPLNLGDPQINTQCDFQPPPQFLPASTHCSSDSYSNYLMDAQKPSCASPDSEFDDANTDNYSTESCLASENSRIVVDTIEDDLPTNSKPEELSVSGPQPMWLEGDESVALWVKVSPYPNLKVHNFFLH